MTGSSDDVFTNTQLVIWMLGNEGAIDSVLEHNAADFQGKVAGHTTVHMVTTSPAYPSNVYPRRRAFRQPAGCGSRTVPGDAGRWPHSQWRVAVKAAQAGRAGFLSAGGYTGRALNNRLIADAARQACEASSLRDVCLSLFTATGVCAWRAAIGWRWCYGLKVQHKVRYAYRDEESVIPVARPTA